MGMRLLTVFAITFTLAHGAMRFQNTNDVQFKPDLADDVQKRQAEECEGTLEQSLLDEIRSHQAVANQIIDYVMNGSFKGKTYQEVHDLVDKFPIRMSGFQNLEDSIDYTLTRMREEHKLENVRGEQVKVPHWIR